MGGGGSEDMTTGEVRMQLSRFKITTEERTKTNGGVSSPSDLSCLFS